MLTYLISAGHFYQACSESRGHTNDGLEPLAGLLLSHRPSAMFSAPATLERSPRSVNFGPAPDALLEREIRPRIKFPGFGHIEHGDLPDSPTQMLARLTARNIGFLGDSVYLLAFRERMLWPPGDFEELTERETELVSAAGQTEILNEVFKKFKLHSAETTWIQRGKNSKVKTRKVVSEQSYKRASGLESLVGALYLSNPERCRELMNLILEGVGVPLGDQPEVSPEMVETLSTQHLAWIGDAVYSNAVREKFVYPPSPINELHKRVQVMTTAKGQNFLYHQVWTGFRMTWVEKEILKAAQQSKHRGPARIDPLVYSNAQSLEALIGYLHLTNSGRLKKLMKFLFHMEGKTRKELDFAKQGAFNSQRKIVQPSFAGRHTKTVPP